jgi:hypothetical protein
MRRTVAQVLASGLAAAARAGMVVLAGQAVWVVVAAVLLVTRPFVLAAGAATAFLCCSSTGPQLSF